MVPQRESNSYCRGLERAMSPTVVDDGDAKKKYSKDAADLGLNGAIFSFHLFFVFHQSSLALNA